MLCFMRCFENPEQVSVGAASTYLAWWKPTMHMIGRNLVSAVMMVGRKCVEDHWQCVERLP